MIDGVETSIDVTGHPDITTTRFINGKRCTRAVRVLSGFSGGATYNMHNNSLNNLSRGVVERVLYTRTPEGLVPPLRPVQQAFERLSGVSAAVLRKTCPTTVVSRDEYPELYSGRKRLVYERAVASLSAEAVSRRDAIVRVFVKAEKVAFSASKPDPVPRVIQPRHPRYNVEVGRYLKNFEKLMYLGFERAFGYKVILKGLNATETATAIKGMWDTYKKPVGIGLDASRFDQHVSSEALDFEHRYYNSVFNSPELKKLLSWQKVNFGKGMANDGSIAYKVNGCRMSGDINTSMGNCFIMSCAVLSYLEEENIDARLGNNGDDCVVICESRDEHKFSTVSQWFRDLGFRLTFEKSAYELEHVVFCQQQPVFTDSGYRMVRDPRTATSKDVVSRLSWATEIEFNRWRNAIGTCGLELTRGVPFWESFYGKIWAPATHESSINEVNDSGMGYMAKGVKACRISSRSRYSFWLAFGITPDQQVALENLETSISYEEGGPMMSQQIEQYSLLLQTSQ